MLHRPLGDPPRAHPPHLPAPSPPHLTLGAPDLNQNQGGSNHKVTAEKPAKKPEEKKADGEKDDDTGAPPEHLHLDTGAPPERPHAQTEKGAHQGPPPLKAAAEKLINNNIRGSTKKMYKSRLKTFTDYCTKQGANMKSCPPYIVINYLTMLALDKGRDGQ